MSSPSRTSEEGSGSRSPPAGSHVSRASSSPFEWSSDSEDRIPLAQRQVAARAPPQTVGRAPSGRFQARAGPSSRAGAESPEGVASVMTDVDLAKIQARYQIPEEFGLFLPTPNDRIVSSRAGRVAMYEICLKVGLRLPLHSFFLEILKYYSLTPSQLVPNSLRVICAFVVLCHHLGITPRVSLFRNFYILRSQKGWWLFQPRPNRVLKLALPSSIKGWKSRFFFVDLPSVKPRWGNPDLRGNANPSVRSGDREALHSLLSTEIPRYTLFLRKENLVEAGLLPPQGKSFHPIPLFALVTSFSLTIGTVQLWIYPPAHC